VTQTAKVGGLYDPDQYAPGEQNGMRDRQTAFIPGMKDRDLLPKKR